MEFKNKAALAAWADDHTTAEVLAFYNALPGVKPVKRFEDRKIAVTRIWAALQGTEAAAAAGPLADAFGAEKPAKEPKRAKAAKVKRSAKKAKKAQAAKPARTGGAILNVVQDLVSRKNGATLAEIMKATSWQKHSVRGFISGVLKKKLGLEVASTRDESGERRYTVVAQ